MEYTKVMGIDFGMARIGIAFSDYLQIIATAYQIWRRSGDDKDIAHLRALMKENNVKIVVFGLPFQTDGQEGDIAAFTRDFAEKLVDGTGAALHYIDERFTSYEAEQYLKEAKIPWQERKRYIDKVAAQIILQNYLDCKK